MSMLDGRKAYAPLQLNTKYHAILKGYKEYEPTEQSKQSRPDSQGFIVFNFELAEDGRPFSTTNSFPQGVDIFARQVLSQTQQPNAIDQISLFRHCIENQVPLETWVTQNGEFFNHTFQEPKATATASTSSAVDTEGFK